MLQQDLQFFAERGLEHQTSEQLRKGIVSLQQKIEIHRKKIRNPAASIDGWDYMDERERSGLIRHWKREIAVFEENIHNRRDELRKRGEKL